MVVCRLRVLIVPFVVLGSASGACIRETATAASKTAILQEYHCGVTPDSMTARHEFRYENKTNKAVMVSKITVSCGCLSVVAAPKRIAPGKTGIFVLDLDPRGVLGPVTQQAYVSISEADVPDRVLRLTAVAPGVWTQPSAVDLGKLAPGQTVSQQLHVFAAGKPDAKVLDVAVSNEQFDVSVHEPGTTALKASKTIREIGTVRITYKNDGRGEMGEIRTTVFVKTNVEHFENHIVPIKVERTGVFEVIPPRILFGTVRPGADIERTVTIVPQGTLPRSLDPSKIKVTADHAEVFAEIIEKKSGEETRLVLKVRFSPDTKTRPGLLKGSVRGRIDDTTLFVAPYIGFVLRRQSNE